MRGTPAVRRRVRLRPVRPAGWWWDAVLLAALAALTVALAGGHLLGVDLAVRDWADAHRPQGVYWFARVLNFLGQGGWLLVPGATALAIAVGVRARSIRPLLVVVVAFLATYLTIGPMKLWTERAAPSSKLPPEVSVRVFHPLPPGEYAMSYPSGHVANAIVWYAVIALLVAALLRTHARPDAPSALYRAIRVGPPAVVFVTTTYLGYHWLTDSIGGLLAGVLLARLLARLPWDDVPLPALPGGLERPALFTPAP